VVVVDREPRPVETGSKQTTADQHEISAEEVQSELNHAGLEIVSRQDHFILNDPYGESWWLLTARKP
jgi:hypothetical protein